MYTQTYILTYIHTHIQLVTWYVPTPWIDWDMKGWIMYVQSNAPGLPAIFR
jgi:hypothetical protein